MSTLSLQLDRTHFEPGERVLGTIRWDHSGKKAQMVRLSLVWHTEGKGSEDAETVAQVEIRSPPPSGRERFGFDLPPWPWSFSGKLVSIVWTVEASLEPGGELARVELVMGPGREERRF